MDNELRQQIQTHLPFRCPFLHIVDFSYRFDALYDLQDNVIYHPERTVQAHIYTVVERINRFKWKREVEKQTMLCVAWLHDICKRDDGRPTLNQNNQWYWTNPEHPQQAAQLIHANDELQYTISQLGCDWRLVAEICRYHDDVKALDLSNNKHVERFHWKIMSDDNPLLFNYLVAFRFFDDMIDRFEMPELCMSPFNKIDVN